MLQFNEEKHEYRWDGRILPSVTQVLGSVAVKKATRDGGTHWEPVGASDYCHDEVARRFGLTFHTVVAMLLADRKPLFDSALIPWVRGFHKFCREKLDKLVAHANVSKELHVFDWKTSTSRQEWWHYQIAAYGKMVPEWSLKQGPWTGHVRIEEPMCHSTYRYAGKPDLALGNLTKRGNVHLHCVRFYEDGYDDDEQESAKHPGDWAKFLSCLNIVKGAK